MKGSFKGKAAKYGRLSQSILNGVVGDYLQQRNNPLAIQMGFYHQFNRLDLASPLGLQLPGSPLSNKLVVLVHGLTNLETVWDFPKARGESDSEVAKTASSDERENYGTRLQRDYGYTPLFLRYNTGLAVEFNGIQLAEQLEQLIERYPLEVDELVLIGFSMGGLLLRHAQKNAIESNKTWLDALSKCIYIGTPHEGSPLEKFGNIAGELVRDIPIDYVNHWAKWIDIRSQGIKDLKDGLKPLSEGLEQLECPSFYSGSNHYFISGTVGSHKDSLSGKLMGDTLVRQASALPGARPNNSHHAHFENLPHVPLAHSERVYGQIAQWVSEGFNAANSKVQDESACAEKPSLGFEAKPHELLAGATELIADTAGMVIDTSETMHKSIANVPYGILKKIPVVSQLSEPVEVVHKGIADVVFGSVKIGSKKARRLAKSRKT